MPIGGLARRSGLSVKTIRFYSDEGLLPPSGRTEAGYRLYGERDLARLELIRTLRDAGIDLATIRSVLERDLTLGEALQLRLRAVEAHITSLQRVAAALRLSLRSEPTDDDLRRLHAVTRISNEERRAVVERFYEEVMGDLPVDESFRQMMTTSVPDLPEEPTQQQLDAWIELAGILSDRGFVESMRAMTEQSWGGDDRLEYDQSAYHASYWELMSEVGALRDQAVSPGSDEVTPLVDRFVQLSAPMFGGTDTPELRRKLLESYTRHDPRAARYWELVALMRGDDNGYEMTVRQNATVAWLVEALRLRVAP